MGALLLVPGLLAGASPPVPPAPQERPVPRVTFTDVTVAAGLVPEGARGHDVGAMRGGAAALDFDRDGDQDLFVLGRGLRPDALFANRGDGTFEERAAAAGVARTHRGGGVCAGDVDRDGWIDLYVTSEGPREGAVGRHLLWHNEGDGTFREVARAAGVATTSPSVPDGFGCAFGDLDLDGDLDLFVAGWRPGSEGNRLFVNRGDGTFDERTAAAGLELDGVAGFTPTFADMDGDRWPELLLVGDFGTSRYFVNRRDGTFREATLAAGVGLELNGMGSAVADLDGDLRLDWYVTSTQNPGIASMLYVNRGAHRYDERGVAAGVAEAGWGWGAAALDADLDGRLDLCATNGFAKVHPFDGDPTRLWRNEGALRFRDLAREWGLEHRINGLSVVRLDLEPDGDPDLLITSAQRAQLRLFRNDQTTGHHWLRVVLDTRGEPGLAPDGYGARVLARAGGRTQLRVLHGGPGYLGTHELVASFGLGSCARVEELRVEWPDGRVTRRADVAADRQLVLRP